MATENKTWIITGAGRGLGVDIAEAALTAGSNVVATGRNTASVAEALGDADNLLAAKLDATTSQDAQAAVEVKEQEADADKAAGRMERFESDEAFLAALEERRGSSDADV
jgi:NAD(P)-dependent dehydrogenase (short-subunit alcohol dehydrogenase family)